MPKLHHVAGGSDPLALAYVVLVFAVMFAPLLFRRRSSSPGTDSDGSEGGGGGPSRTPDEPRLPGGGIPLPDADQSSVRRRDHGGFWPGRRTGRQRPAHAPERERRRTRVA